MAPQITAHRNRTGSRWYQCQPDAPDKPGSPPDRKVLFLPRALEGNLFLPVVVFQAPDRPARHHRSRYAGRGCFGLPFAVSILNVRWESNRYLRVRRALRREGGLREVRPRPGFCGPLSGNRSGKKSSHSGGSHPGSFNGSKHHPMWSRIFRMTFACVLNPYRSLSGWAVSPCSMP